MTIRLRATKPITFTPVLPCATRERATLKTPGSLAERNQDLAIDRDERVESTLLGADDFEDVISCPRA
ncbi:hypothetical protein PQX77_020228 [Marasmius sp. AFHP31]|nr:hypothetical protein PQX77_020228 [Marasmius sp. AFHP31]